MPGLGWDSRRLRAFRAALARWYDAQQRHLPWRSDCDPYRVWISEIMLQQTRVAAVIPYYERFLARFPTVQALARAREASVLALWSGLGYYRRARMLHRAAKQMVREHSGTVPRTIEALQSLPGIGTYTAAAVGSIAFGLRAAVVDGNVERVLGRASGQKMSRTQVQAFAQQLLDPARPGDHNQAMMELGATLCTPKSPNCGACPVRRFCATRGAEPRSSAELRQQRDIAYGFGRKNGSLWLVQRAAGASLMAGMWELPEVRVSRSSFPGSREALLTVRHSITTTDYRVCVYPTEPPLPRHTAEGARSGKSGQWVPIRTLERLPLTGLTRKILRKLEVLV